ncbi:uncharacterized protein E5676_scaffold692G00720 [Cucumis melo var. makuwa]|uniref:Retrotransposon gag domain-containing protein n=1 Tax=Cucumis melo var. makuwa TaxID=1194695 RepID=A0A5D3CS31_CUCMM|nr:uncharacterized protein E6C27_scaffold749G00700 [Cucumis melo var. makuwa]TYK14737.1 uncharacterized protein E5676_scaffold692G00720 [Cucumis melo var. makuwa]
MSSTNPSDKAQRDRLVELEEQMLYLVEVLDSIRILESHLEEIVEKADTADAVVGRVKGLPIQELLARVNTLEGKVGRTGSHKRGDSSTGSVAHIEERVQELDSSQKTLLEMCEQWQTKLRLEGQFWAMNTVTEEAKVTLATMHLSEDAKLWWSSQYVDMQEGRCTIDTWDALKKELCSQFFPENVEILSRRKLHELKHTGSISEYVKQFAGLMLEIRDMSEKDKVFCFVEGLKSWAKTKLYEQRVQDLMSVYAAAKQLFNLTNDSQNVRRHQSSSPGRKMNSRPSSPKAVRGDKRSSKDRRPYQLNTENTW